MNAWQTLRPIRAPGSLRERKRESADSPTHAHAFIPSGRRQRARLGNADARLQCYAWDKQSVWKLYCTRRRRGDICGLKLLGNVKYFMLRNSWVGWCACAVKNECVVGSVCVCVCVRLWKVHMMTAAPTCVSERAEDKETNELKAVSRRDGRNEIARNGIVELRYRNMMWLYIQAWFHFLRTFVCRLLYLYCTYFILVFYNFHALYYSFLFSILCVFFLRLHCLFKNNSAKLLCAKIHRNVCALMYQQ